VTIVPTDAPNQSGLYVQYGCGLCAPAGWLNFDASPRLTLERLPLVGVALQGLGARLFPVNVRSGDIVKGLPMSDGSCAGIYCSHVLEHIPRNNAITALQNTAKLLKRGGIFRMIVPDLQWRAEHYLRAVNGSTSSAADQFLDSCILGRRTKPQSPMAILREYLGNSAHLWMYDFDGMKELLDAAGFVDIRRCEFGDAQDPMFSRVENMERFVDSGQRELAVEGIKAN
jgi:SAM-dependent methyltransferase